MARTKMRHRATMPFYMFSSYNKRGGKVHPMVASRRNRALDMFADMMTIADIAAALEVDTDTVKFYIRHARRNGDPRACRGIGNRRYLRAKLRRKQIAMLAETGMKTSEIAQQLDCHVRLVQIRLKEMA